MDQIAPNNGMLLIHSEDDDMVHYNYSLAQDRGQWDWWNMHLIHSNVSEDVSFRRALRLAEQKGSPVYFVHVSAREGVESHPRGPRKGNGHLRRDAAQLRQLHADNYREDDGMKYHTYPSLKSEDDRSAPLGRPARRHPLHRSDRPRVHHLGSQDQVQDRGRRDRRP